MHSLSGSLHLSLFVAQTSSTESRCFVLLHLHVISTESINIFATTNKQTSTTVPPRDTIHKYVRNRSFCTYCVQSHMTALLKQRSNYAASILPAPVFRVVATLGSRCHSSKDYQPLDHNNCVTSQTVIELEAVGYLVRRDREAAPPPPPIPLE
jgi:hypothetical protein